MVNSVWNTNNQRSCTLLWCSSIPCKIIHTSSTFPHLALLQLQTLIVFNWDFIWQTDKVMVCYEMEEVGWLFSALYQVLSIYPYILTGQAKRVVFRNETGSPWYLWRSCRDPQLRWKNLLLAVYSTNLAFM